MNPGLVVKLRPTGPWRIGPDSGARNRVDAIYHSDSLYSAVTSAMLRLGWLEEWLDATARAGDSAVRFSSCFPFQGDLGYVVPPRTLWPPVSPGQSGRVRWKSARFVPLGIVQALLAGQVPEENHWSVDGTSECLVPAGQPGPFRTAVRWSAAVDRLSGASERHSSACIEFREGAGLWTIVSFAGADAWERWGDRVKTAFRVLADSGFGGERSRGWGRAETPEFVEGELPDMILPPTEPVAEIAGALEVADVPVGEPLVVEPVVEAAPAEPACPADSGESTIEGAASTVSADPLVAEAELRAPELIARLAAQERPERTEASAEAPAAEPAVDKPVEQPPAALSPVEDPPVEQPLATQSPVEEPPVEQPPAAQSPVEDPPVEQPPAAQSPVEEPPVGQPLAVEPPVGEPPVEQPPAAQSPVEEPPVEQSPAAQASAESAVEQPPAAQSPVEEPPVGQPLAVEPPVGEPPVEQSPAAQSPGGESPVEQHLAVEPPVEEPPVEQSPAAQSPVEAPPVEVPPAAEPPVEPPVEPPPVEEPPVERPPVEEPPQPAPAAQTPPAAKPERKGTAAANVAQPQWLLGLFTPSAEDRVDWSAGNYTVMTRGGRVDSPAQSGVLKKHVNMVTEGSVLHAPAALRGGAPDVAPDGFPHPVFRAGFAVAIPLGKGIA